MLYVIIVVLVIIIVSMINFDVNSGCSDILSLPDYHIKSIKSFLGYDFKGEYKILKYHSKEFHPDHPVKISISLSDNDFDQVKMYLQKLELKTTETLSADGNVSYKDSWSKETNIYMKSHEASYVDSGYPFYIAMLEIDCEKNTLRYSETGV